MKKILSLLFSVLLLATAASAQTTVTQTTLSSAITTTNGTTAVVASATGISASTNTQQYLIFVDEEAMQVTAVSSTTLTVIRGVNGTMSQTHASGALVYFGPSGGTGGSPFWRSDPPLGSCSPTAEAYNLRINLTNGNKWQCFPPNATTGNGVWVNVIDGVFFVGPANCVAAVSGTGGTGNNTLIVDGNAVALKASSTNAGASNATFTCSFQMPPSRTDPGRSAYLSDITYLYSVQTTTATSMVASTLKSFTAPAAGTSETASSATLVAVGGTLVHNPVVGSANLTAVSAGQYYSEQISPASGTLVTLNTDLQSFVFTFQINQSASAAQIVTTPGFWVHYRSVTGQ